MKFLLFLFLGLMTGIASAPGNGWQELRNAGGQVVQLVATFDLEDIRVRETGAATFRATVNLEDGPAGFLVKVGQPQAGTVQREPKYPPLPVMRMDVEVRSVGQPTDRLESFLNSRLQTGGGYYVTGYYSGASWMLASAIHGPCFIHAGSVGVPTGDTPTGDDYDFFELILLLDVPLKRATVYFSRPAGYGGTSEVYRARQKWFESIRESSIPDQPPANP